MLKMTLVVQQKKDSEDCTVKIELPKNIDEATPSEKNVGGAVYQVLADRLKQLEQTQK